ncbi:MAG: hypothetical protein AABY15_04865 [Nanoarchaeota archaeon]
MINLRFKRMVKYITERYPNDNEILLARKLLILAENKGYHKLMGL